MDPTMLFSLGNTIGEGINQFGLHLREDMQYKRSKRDSIEFWNMQNAYNAPQAQMQRLKAAGLNPALIYGGSSGGASGTAGSFQTPVNPQISERRSRGNVLSDYYDIKMKQAQLSNVLAQNEAIKEEANLKRAQIRGLIAGAARQEYDLGFFQEFRKYSGDALILGNERTRAEIAYQLGENARREKLTASNLRQASSTMLSQEITRSKDAEEIRRLKLLQEMLQSDVRIRQYQEGLMKDYGLTPSTPLPQNALQMWWKFLDNIYDLIK